MPTLDLMRLYDTAKNFIRVIADPIDTKIEYDIKLDDKILSFKVVDSELILNEQYIRFYGQEWVVKATRRDGQYIEITAKHNIEAVVGNVFNSVKTSSLNLNDTLSVIFSGANSSFTSFGWTYALSANLASQSAILSKRRSIDVENITFLATLEEVLSLWFLEIEFDTLNKQVIFHHKRGENKGVYFTSQLNLRKIDLEVDTYEYATRLVPVGKDNLRIASVNGGLNYVSNYAYSDKIITAVWVDTRYTSATNLRDDAILKLAELSSPLRVYGCDIVDLSAQNPMLSYELGDTVTLINEQLGIKDVQRIMKMEVYPYDSEKNTAELANRRGTFQDIQNQLLDSRDTVNATILSNGQVSGYNVVGINKNFIDIESDVDGMTTNIGQITEEINEVVTYSRGILLSNESQSFAVDSDGLTALDFTPIYSKIGTYQGGGRVASAIGSIDFFTSSNLPITLPLDATVNTVNPTSSEDGEISIVLPKGTDLGSTSGYIRIPVIIGGTTYLKRLYWSAIDLGNAVEGMDGITVVLSNESAVVATDSEGDNGDLSQAFTYIQVFVGIINDTPNWSFTANPINASGAFDSIETNKYQVTDLSADNGAIEITATKSTTSIVKVFSLTKAKSGTAGEQGQPGPSYWLETEVAVVPVNEFGAYKVNDILVRARVSTGTDIENYLGRFKIEEFSRISATWSTVYTSSVNQETYVHTIGGNVSSLRFTLYEADSTTNTLDIQTVPMVYDGLSNRYVSIQATSQIFESTDGGINFNPSSIYLTPIILNATFDKWQFSYDGENFIDLPISHSAWGTGVDYTVGQIVSYADEAHQCLVDHTSTTAFDDLLTTPASWESEVYYNVGTIVEFNGEYYQASGEHTSTAFAVDRAEFWVKIVRKWITVSDVIVTSRGTENHVLQIPSNSALFLYSGELAFNLVFRVFVNYDKDGSSLSAFDTITVARTFNSTELVNIITESYATRIDSLEKFETEVGQRIYYGEAYNTTNLVTNGDFSNNTTGWLFSNAGTPYVADNELSITPTAAPSSSTTTQHAYQTFNVVTGNTYYGRAMLYGATTVRLQITSSVLANLTQTNVWQTLSGVWTSTVTGARAFGVRDSKASAWTVTKAKRLMFIDLTATFGAGNEPTKDEMDAIIDKFSDKWFSGTGAVLRDEPLVTNFTNWKQQVDNFLLNVQSGGGYNLIQNSVGYRDMASAEATWNISGAGTIISVGANDSSFINASESKNGFQFTGSKLITQVIPVVPARKLSLSVNVNTQETTSGTIRVYAILNGTTFYLVNKSHDVDNPLNSTFQLNLTTGTATNITIGVESVSVVGKTYVTDLLLAYGENITQWQQANGENHNLNVLIDRHGMRVKSIVNGVEVGYTSITPSEFAGYHQGNKIFTLNGTLTEVQELKIVKAVGAAEDAITIAPFKIVQTPTSLDFVWIGDIN